MTFGVLGASSANASYMSNCNTLISAWEACKETGQSCAAENTAIEKQCKCHVLKGNDWKLIKAAVGKDGVCGKPPTTIIIPPPPPPPPTHITRNPGNGGAGGGDDKGGDPPRDPNGGRGN